MPTPIQSAGPIQTHVAKLKSAWTQGLVPYWADYLHQDPR